MQPEQLQFFAWAIIKLGFVSGLAGAATWSLVSALVSAFADSAARWEEKRLLIIQARARSRARAHG